MDTKRLSDWAGSAEALRKFLAGLAPVVLYIWTDSTKDLASVARSLGLPAWAPRAAAALVIAGFVWVLFRSFRRFAQASRLEQPDAFTLRPTGPATLIGRTKDTASLLKCVKQYRLVLLDGESGCGKSALVSAGLAPELAQTNGLMPVAIADWGDDWVRGPLAAALDALFHSLCQKEREQLGWLVAPDLATDTPNLAADLDARLKAVFDTLGRRPLLIADQFDDYQARHRSRFLDDETKWLAPAALVSTNRFWELVKAGLGMGRLHLLVITRADMAAGLSCVRFLGEDQIANYTLPRVDVEYLHPLLTGIATEDAKPVVVSHPEGGWHELLELLERDLVAEGLILMQQVRTVLLGLRQLPLLTPMHYRAAGGLRGVETLVVSRAVRNAGDKAGGGEAGRRIVRAVLRELILPGGPNQMPKARRALHSDLSNIAGDRPRAESILGVLRQEQIARPAYSVGGENAWQLDHDYLARAVLAEERLANRWSMALCEGKAHYEEAAGDWRRRWAALLPVGTLMRVCWERWRKRLSFGDAASYAWRSAVRPAVVLLSVAVVGVTTYTWNQDRLLTLEANGLISRFVSDGEGDAVMRVWRAPESLRRRVHRLILTDADKDASRLQRATRTAWPLAHAGFEPPRVLEAVTALRLRLEQEKNSAVANDVGLAYAAVAARLTDPAELKTAATALRLRLEQEKDAEIASSFAQAYAAVSGAMVERANPQVPPTLVIEILTMAGHPYVKDIEPLLFALKPAAGVDFGSDVGAAVRWATQTYRIKPDQLRPQPVPH